MSNPTHDCPVCGGNIIGDGSTSPMHCENVELPIDRECDASVLHCSEGAS